MLPFGQVIVKGRQQAWLVPAQGRTVHLPGVEAVAWSPALRLLAVTERDRLTVRAPDGTTRWARRYGASPAPALVVGHAVRLAFLAGRALRSSTPAAGERRLGLRATWPRRGVPATTSSPS